MWTDLASCYYEQDKYADAEPLYQRELVVEEEALGPEHPSVVNLLSLLGSCYYKQGKYTQAEPIYQRIVATLDKVPRLDTLNFFTLVVSLKVLASCYYNQGNYAKAEPLYQRVLAIYEKEWGREDLDVATVLEQYAALPRKTGGSAKADTLEERAKSIRARNTQERPTQ
jgi:tetratricopeptide (TPR) repeat protein